MVFKKVELGGKVVEIGAIRVQLVRKLADGSQATVYLGRDLVSGNQLAVKKTCPRTQADMDAAQREVALVRQFHHPNVARHAADKIEQRTDGTRRKSYIVWLALDFYGGGTLQDLAAHRRKVGCPFSEVEVWNLLVQMGRAVEYLHRHKPAVAHRDIRLNNFLVSTTGRVVLCDFGSCTTAVTRCKTQEERRGMEQQLNRSTSVANRAPELCDLFSDKLISEKVDVWALGCAAFRLVFGRRAFEEGGKLGILSGKVSYPESHHYSATLMCAIEWLLTCDPEARPEIGDVVDYFEEQVGSRRGRSAAERRSGCGARPSRQLRHHSSSQILQCQADECMPESNAPSLPAASTATEKSQQAFKVAQQRILRRVLSNNLMRPAADLPSSPTPLHRRASEQILLSRPREPASPFDPFESGDAPPSTLWAAAVPPRATSSGAGPPTTPCGAPAPSPGQSVREQARADQAGAPGLTRSDSSRFLVSPPSFYESVPFNQHPCHAIPPISPSFCEVPAPEVFARQEEATQQRLARESWNPFDAPARLQSGGGARDELSLTHNPFA